MIPVLQQVFGLKGKEEYTFKSVVLTNDGKLEGKYFFLSCLMKAKVRESLNSNFSLFEHKITQDAKLLLYPLSAMEEVCSGSRSLMKKRVTLGSLENTQKSDWLCKYSKKGRTSTTMELTHKKEMVSSIGDFTSLMEPAKATPEKRRWCVVDQHFLYYFADKKPGSKPNGIIPLDYMVRQFRIQLLFLRC